MFCISYCTGCSFLYKNNISHREGGRSSQEPPGTARRRQEQARSSQDEAGAARGSQARPGAARSRHRQEQARICQDQPGAARSSQEPPRAARSSQEQRGADMFHMERFVAGRSLGWAADSQFLNGTRAGTKHPLLWGLGGTSLFSAMDGGVWHSACHSPAPTAKLETPPSNFPTFPIQG